MCHVWRKALQGEALLRKYIQLLDTHGEKPCTILSDHGENPYTIFQIVEKSPTLNFILDSYVQCGIAIKNLYYMFNLYSTDNQLNF